MNKIFSAVLVLAATATFTSCVQKEEDDLFDHSAAERLNAASALYSQRLTASPNGWAMQLYPTTKNEAPYGNGYLVLCDFDEDKSVKVAMNNSLTNNSYKEDRSGWDVITDNGPVLSFSTYNSVMHLFSNPENVSGTEDDETGRGVEGDYEFIIVDAPEDASYMMLKGKKRGTYNLFTPIEEGVDYQEYLADVKSFQNKMFSSDAPTFNVMYFGENVYKMEDANDGIPNVYPYDGDAVIDESFNPFLVTKRGDQYYLRFRDAIDINDEETVQDFHYNTETDHFESVDNQEYFISGDDPLRFFKQAVLEDGNEWRWTRKTEMSDDIQTLLDKISSSITRGNLNRVALKQGEDNKMEFILYYTVSGSGSSTANYIFSYNFDEDGLSLQYEGPKATKDNNFLSRTDGVADLLSALSQKFTVTPAVTAFDLNNVKLTGASGMWFVATLY